MALLGAKKAVKTTRAGLEFGASFSGGNGYTFGARHIMKMAWRGPKSFIFNTSSGESTLVVLVRSLLVCIPSQTLTATGALTNSRHGTHILAVQLELHQVLVK